MATPPIDSLVEMIKNLGLRIGNKVLSSTNTDLTSAKVVYVNTTGDLTSVDATASSNLVINSSQALTTVYPSTVNQPTNTNPVFDITANGLEGVITGSIVYYGGSTVTQTGAFRVLVTDSTGIGATTGTYYIPFGTLA